MLNRAPRVATVILTTTSGTAWTEDGFRSSWGKACETAGIPDGLTFDDLRGTAGGGRLRGARNRYHYGALARQHVEASLDAHYLGRTTKLAQSAVAKLERAARIDGDFK